MRNRLGLVSVGLVASLILGARPVPAAAHRLAGLLYAMLRDGTTYTPRVVARHVAEAVAPV